MGPIRRGDRLGNQQFGSREKLYRREPPDCINSFGEIEPSSISLSFGKDVKGSPSVVRGKYATPRDVTHAGCANQRDVSSHAVFYLRVEDLPASILSGVGESFEFFPFHDPEKDCYAHTVIGCKISGAPAGSYARPSNSVKNQFKARLVASLRRVEMPTGAVLFALDLRKNLAFWLRL
jgi:hypothetical protein